jgi:hypothetical protein
MDINIIFVRKIRKPLRYRAIYIYFSKYQYRKKKRERELKYEIRELDFPEGSTPFNCVSLNAVSIGKEKKLIGSLKERKEKKKNIIEGVRSMTNCFQLK